jgi:hypothetical protein
MLEYLKKFYDLIELEGESYDLLKKALIYSLIGNTIKMNGIKVGYLVDDTRIHLALPIRSGHGKTTCKRFIKNTITALGRRYSEPTSLHPEQLVGKSVEIRNKEGQVVDKKVIFGHLADDYVVFEEALELLKNKEYQIARDYINVATDPIGYNEIYKRNVDVDIEDAVKYIPTATICLLFHPIGIDINVVERGLLRRFFTVCVEPSKEEKIKALEISIKKVPNRELFIEWIDYLKRLETKNYVWKIEDNPLIDYCKKLIQRGEMYSEQTRDLAEIMYFTLRNRLIKLSCINAGASGTDIVDERFISDAYKDAYEFWVAQSNYIEQFVKQDMTYMLPRKKREKVYSFIIRYLIACGATNQQNSNITLKELIERTAEANGCSKGLVYYYYNELKKHKIVDDIVIPSNISRVWLCVNEDEETILRRIL